ncbi:MAG: PLP-dependent aminotransferase family protein, partial [Gordonia sp. (in: high G+C Gram-positive bacteria)]
YLARARGVQTDAQSLVICEGFRGGQVLLAAALAGRTDPTVAIEDPSLPGIDIPWRTAGWRVVDLPVDDDGARVDLLTPQIDVVVLTPSHQFPLGGALSPARRRQLAAWAAQTGGFIVEDDYDGEFRFDRRPVPAVQRSAPTRVIYVGSVSKTLDPHLRIGWLALPRDLVASVTDAARALSGGVPILNQLALAELIDSGDYERHIRRQRREYARRREHLREALRDIGIDAPGISAGLHACIPVATRPDDRADAMVAVHLLDRYVRSHPMPAALVVGFGAPPRRSFETAIDALIRELGPPEHV